MSHSKRPDVDKDASKEILLRAPSRWNGDLLIKEPNGRYPLKQKLKDNKVALRDVFENYVAWNIAFHYRGSEVIDSDAAMSYINNKDNALVRLYREYFDFPRNKFPSIDLSHAKLFVGFPVKSLTEVNDYFLKVVLSHIQKIPLGEFCVETFFKEFYDDTDNLRMWIRETFGGSGIFVDTMIEIFKDNLHEECDDDAPLNIPRKKNRKDTR